MNRIGEKNSPLITFPHLQKNKSFFGIFRTYIFPPFRSVKNLLENGIIILDKPFGVSTKELEVQLQKLMGSGKVRIFAGLEKFSSGCSLVLFGNSLCFLKNRTKMREDFLGVLKISSDWLVESLSLKKEMEKFQGFLLQRGSFFPSFKRYLVLKKIFFTFFLEYRKKLGILSFFISCESNLDFKSFISSLNVLIGKKCQLKELRRIKVGPFSEENFSANFHGLMDAIWLYRSKNNDFLLRKFIIPLELIFLNFRKFIIKNSAINALCFGAKLSVQGILGVEKNIEKGEETILVSSKGEAIAVAISGYNTQEIFLKKTGFVAEIKTVIMPKNTYPKQWGLGFSSTKKKILISTGILKNFR